MSEHDVVGLNANFNNWKKERAAGLTKIEPFLYYSVDHITKRFNLTDEQIRYGITDDSNDGRIDAIYILSGKAHSFVRDDDGSAAIPSDEIRIVLFQVKSSLTETGYKPDDIDSFAKFLNYLLDLSGNTDPTGEYTDTILSRMRLFKDKYIASADNFPSLKIDIYYVTRGDGVTLNRAGEAAVNRIKAAVLKHRQSDDKDEVTFNPIDTGGLRAFVKQRRQKSRRIRWNPNPLPLGNSYVGLVKLPDYHEFLKSETGALDELIFESNVRGNQGNSTVNRQLRKTLALGGRPDFWQLNNGITITCSRIEPIDASSIQAVDAQVVNGLQTSRQIFAHFSEHPKELDTDTRSVLVKVLPVSDDAIRDRIIRATNNQNPMKAAALRATEDKHRDIEDLFKQYGLYYDRRPGYYKDQGKPIANIISLTDVIQAVVSLVLHRPDDARARPGDYLRETKKRESQYSKVFGSPARIAFPLALYLQSIAIVRKITRYLGDRTELSRSDRVNLVFYVSFYAVCVAVGTSAPTVEEILELKGVALSEDRLDAVLAVVEAEYRQLISPEHAPDSVAKGTALLDSLNARLKSEYGQPSTVATVRKIRRTRDVLKAHEVKWGEEC